MLVLRYVPEEVSVERRQTLNRYAGLRYKALVARENGARALLVVSGPNSPRSGELVPLKFDRVGASSGIVTASISGKAAEALFSYAEKDLKTVQSDLDQENPHALGSFLLPKVKVKLSTGVERVKKPDRNVIGVLPATAHEGQAESVISNLRGTSSPLRGEFGLLAKMAPGRFWW